MLNDFAIAEINHGVVTLLRSDLRAFHELATSLKKTPDEMRQIADNFDTAPVWLLWKISAIYEVSIDFILSGWAGFDDEAMQSALLGALQDALPEMDLSRNGLRVHAGPYRFVDGTSHFIHEHCELMMAYLTTALRIVYDDALGSTAGELEADEASGLYDPWAAPTGQLAQKPRRRAKARRE